MLAERGDLEVLEAAAQFMATDKTLKDSLPTTLGDLHLMCL